MSVTITSRPDATLTDTSSGTKTGRWLAVNAEYPVLFELTRKDELLVVMTRNNDDTINFSVSGDFSAEVSSGDVVYLHSLQFPYINGSYTVDTVVFSGGITFFKTVEPMAGTWSSDAQIGNYVNFITSRLDHRVNIRVMNASSLREIGSADYVGFNSGLIKLDISEWVKLPLAIEDTFSGVNSVNDQSTIRFYIEFTERYGAFEDANIDTFTYNAVSGAMQLQAPNAPNLLDYTAFNADIEESEKAQFLTEFEQPRHFVGYPAKYGFILETEGTFPAFERIEEKFNQFDNPTGTETDALVDEDYRFMNFGHLSGNYATTDDYIDFYIGSDLATGDTCSQLDATDWKYQSWVINSSFVDGIYMEENAPASLIGSITSYPSGTIYRDGIAVDTATYNAGLGYYVPDSGTGTLGFFGTMKLEVLNVPVLTTAGEACTLTFEHELEGSNAPPEALSVTLAVQGGGTLEAGAIIEGTYTFSDADGDAEGTSIYSIREYTSQALADADTDGTGGTEVATDQDYTILASDGGNYYRFWVTPVSVAAPTNGAIAGSNTLGPVLQALATVQHSEPADFDIYLQFDNGASYTVDWGDGNQDDYTGSTVIELREHTYAGAGTYDVKIYGTNSEFTNIRCSSQDVIDVDLENAGYLANFQFNSNSIMTALELPAEQYVDIINWQAKESDIQSNLTMPTAANLDDANIEFQGNANLPSINWDNCTGTFQTLRVDRTDIATFNLPAGLDSASSGVVSIYGFTCPLLAAIDISNLTGRLDICHFYDGALTGTIDFGSVAFNNGNVQFHNNSCTGWDISTCTGDLNIWRFDNNSLAGTQTIDLAFDGVLTNNLIYLYNNTGSNWDLDLTGSSGNMYGIRFQASQYVGTFTDPGFTWTGNAIFTCNDDTTNGLTGLDFSAASGSMNFFDIGGCANLVGTLDLSGFDWQGVAYFRGDNTGLTSVDHTGSTTTSGGFQEYDLINANLTGTHTLGTFTFRATSTLEIRNNSLLTSLDLSNVSGEVKWLYIDNNDISGTVDVTGLDFDGSAAQILAHLNSSFTGFLFNASVTGNLTAFFVYSTSAVLQTNNLGTLVIDETCNFEFFDCGLAAGDVDNWWIEIEDRAASSGASGSLEGGGSNAAPTATSSTERSNLTTAGYTLSI